MARRTVGLGDISIWLDIEHLLILILKGHTLQRQKERFQKDDNSIQKLQSLRCGRTKSCRDFSHWRYEVKKRLRRWKKQCFSEQFQEALEEQAGNFLLGRKPTVLCSSFGNNNKYLIIDYFKKSPLEWMKLGKRRKVVKT